MTCPSPPRKPIRAFGDCEQTIETAINRFKQVIGDGSRSQTDARQDTEIALAIHVLNRMLELGRPNSVHIA